MKGFMGTAAALLFAFSLVTAAYTFMLSQSDLSDSSITGRVVESAKWAVEAEAFQCPTASGVFNSDKGIGSDVIDSVNGNQSDIIGYQTGFIDITIHLETDYAPGVKIQYDSGTNNLSWSPCDPDGDAVTYTLQSYGGAKKMGLTTSTNPLVSDTYWIEAEDSKNNVGYSKKVIVTIV
ncbi:MAG: hypothetical protein KAW41_06455 [Candidatus Diapherotrites archaeon]|nr:hypothetical protein [Candidatus Diapherotrites archaeon]